jgi:cell division protein FtsW (lipid II flippase)
MKNRSIDAWLILTSTLLIVFGLIMVYSASAFSALELVGDEAYYLIRQLIALSVGLVLCVATAVTPMRIIRRYRVVLYSAVLCGLVLCFVPGVRHTANGASRWIGAGGIHWQPSEFAKIIVLIMMADYLDRFHCLHSYSFFHNLTSAPQPSLPACAASWCSSLDSAPPIHSWQPRLDWASVFPP